MNTTDMILLNNVRKVVNLVLYRNSGLIYLWFIKLCLALIIKYNIIGCLVNNEVGRK
jgi:hypothetical protein